MLAKWIQLSSGLVMRHTYVIMQGTNLYDYIYW